MSSSRTDPASQPPDDLREFSLRDVLYVLFRHKGKALLVFVLISVRALMTSAQADAVYESQAKLMMRLGRETVNLDPTATTGQTMNVSRSLSNELNSELEILRSRDLIEIVVDTIGPEKILRSEKKLQSTEELDEKSSLSFDLQSILERFGLREPLSVREQVVELLMKEIDVGVQKNSNIIRIGFEAHSPEIAQSVVNVLIGAFLERHLEVHRTPGSYDFFAEQTNHFREKLAGAQETLSGIRRETGIIDLQEQSKLGLRRIDELEARVSETEARTAASRAKVESLRAALEVLPDRLILQEAMGYPNEPADTLRSRLYSLKLQEKELAAKYPGEDNALKQGVREQISAAETLLLSEDPTRTQVTHGPNANKLLLQQLYVTEATLHASLEAEIREQRLQLKAAYAERTRLSEDGFVIAGLERDIERDEASYDKYSENLEQARIYDALESSKISNISVLQAASGSTIPVGPRRLRNLAVAMFFALFGAVGLAFGAEFLDQTVKTPEETERKLELATLASVPRSRRPTVRASTRWSVDEDDDPATGKGPKRWTLPSAVVEHFENLREQIFHPIGESPESVKVIAVTGCYTGSGASTVAANLAAAVAQADQGQVLLVDANLGAPAIHSFFKAEISPGLADLLANDQRDTQTIQPSPIPGLEILSAGVPYGQRGVNDTQQFADLFQTVRERYRVVIVDLPPIYENAISARLAGLCDGVVLVIESEKLRWQVVDRAKSELERSKANLLGAVLNKRRYPIPEWVYRML